MAYLKNGAVNLLSMTYGLHALAANGAAVFFAVFLLKQGVHGMAPRLVDPLACVKQR